MIDKYTTGQKLGELATEVSSCDKDAAYRLQLLRDAVAQQEYAQAWAASDIYQMINPDLIIERFKDQDAVGAGCLVGGMELVRNSMIFLPILVTWFGISQATSRYNDLLNSCLKACPGQVAQPFLFLWEQGFGGRLPGILTLSSIGLIDASILFIIFTLTWLVSLFNNARNRAQDRRTSRLYNKLVTTLAQASLCLRDKPAPLVSGTENLDDVARQIENIAQTTLNRFSNVADVIDTKFATLATNIETHFAEAAKGFAKVATDLSGHLDDISLELTQQLKESSKQLGVIGQVAGNVAKISTEISTAADALKNVNKEVSANLALLTGPIKDLTRQQQGLLNAANGAVSHLEEAATKLDGMDNRQQQWLNGLRDIAETLETSMNNAEGLINTISDSNKEQQEFLNELQQKGDDLRQAIEGLTDASWATQNALDAMNEGAKDIRSIAIDMEDIKRFAAALSDNNHMRQVVESYSQAAEVIEKSATILNDSADGLFHLIKDLRKDLRQSPR